MKEKSKIVFFVGGIPKQVGIIMHLTRIEYCVPGIRPRNSPLVTLCSNCHDVGEKISRRNGKSLVAALGHSPRFNQKQLQIIGSMK
jgi:hypothetical protein